MNGNSKKGNVAAKRVSHVSGDASGDNIVQGLYLENSGFVLSKLTLPTDPVQALREVAKNAEEARATDFWITPDVIHAEKTKGACMRMLFVDNGRGQTGDEAVANLMGLGHTGHDQNPDAINFGVGGKLTLYRANPAGVEVHTWKDDTAYHLRVKSDKNGNPGLEGWHTQLDSKGVPDPKGEKLKYGENDPVSEQYRVCFGLKHGTAISLNGMTGKENTWCGPDGSFQLYTIVKFLNGKRLSSPKIKIHVWVFNSSDPSTWWDAQQNKLGAGGYRTIEGAVTYWEEAKVESGSIEVSGATIKWWWQKETPPKSSGDTKGKPGNRHSYFYTNGVIAQEYEGETYGLEHGGNAKYKFDLLGLHYAELYKRVAIVVRPNHDLVQPDISRSVLYYRNSKGEVLKEAPWDYWGSEFRKNMPAVIRAAVEACAASRTVDLSSVTDALLDLHKSLEVPPDTGVKTDDPFHGVDLEVTQELVVPSAVSTELGAIDLPSEPGRTPGPPGFPHPPGLFQNLPEGKVVPIEVIREKKKRAARIPKFEDASFEDIGECAAFRYIPSANIVKIWMGFPLIQSRVERFQTLYKYHPGFDDEILVAYKEKLMIAVGGSIILARACLRWTDWSNEFFTKATSPQALTAFDILHVEQDLERQLDKKFKEKATKDSVPF